MNDATAKLLCWLLAAAAVFLLLYTPARLPAKPTYPVPEETVPQTTPRDDAMPLVEEILDQHILDKTALSHCVYDDALHSAEALTGAGSASPAHALARLCDNREMNPIAAFWLLAEEGLYKKTSENSDKLAVPAVRPPEIEKKDYPYTAEGVREFLTELLTLSASFEDDLPLDIRVLGEDGAVEREQIFLEKKNCYYSYHVCYSPEAAYFLCFYIRGGETITDVEFQLLNLRYAEGDPLTLARLDRLCDRQNAALMAAAELLLTGESRAVQGRIPLGYLLNDEYAVSIERYDIVGSGDQGTLTNYRIWK